MRDLWLIGIVLVGMPSVLAQTSEENAKKTLLNEDLWVSPRAAGMAGAVSSVADGVDAPYYNPAGIGGLYWGKTRPPFLRQVIFPSFGAAVNDETKELQKEADEVNAAEDLSAGRALVDARAGRRHYGRVSFKQATTMGRSIFVPFFDSQAAAVPRGGGSDLIDIQTRQQTGIGLGLSSSNKRETFHLGWFGYYATREEAQGEITYDEIVSPESRSDALDEITTKYEGFGNNFGMIWRFADAGRPALGLVFRNIGRSAFKPKDKSKDTLYAEQNMVLSFSVSPKVGQTGAFSWVVEVDQLEDNELSVGEKVSTGVELNLGGFASRAAFGVRAGYSKAGPSAGLTLNLGLLHIEVASQSDSVGVGNNRVTEQRLSGVIYVDVAR